ALRIDKLSLAALEGTLLLHLETPERIPVLRTLAQETATVRARAERLATATSGEVEETVGRVGGGALPLAELPSFACALEESLASDGVFRETEPGVFEHTDLSRQLLDPGWSEFAHLFGGVFFEATTDLDASTSKPPFPDRFGAGFWDWLSAHPTERAMFDAAM